MSELQSILILVLIGFLPSEIWRWLGLALGRGLDEDSEIIRWVRGVATALVAAVVARIIFIPPGTLASVPLSVRVAAITIGFLAFLLVRRSAFAGVLAGEAALIGGIVMFGS
jgi:branched-subunit amino acid transport protein